MCCECGGGTTACGITAGMSTCTFADDYKWMQWTARLDYLASAKIRVDPGKQESTCTDTDLSGELDSNTDNDDGSGNPTGNPCAWYSLSGNSA